MLFNCHEAYLVKQGHAGRGSSNGSSSACYANKLSIDYAGPASCHTWPAGTYNATLSMVQA